MSLHQLSTSIESLYSAAYSPDHWPAALRAVEEFTQSDAAVLSFVPVRREGPGKAIGGSFSIDECREFARDYMRICRRIAFGHDHPEVDYTYDALIMSEEEMDADPVYGWWAKRGLRYHMGAALPGMDGYRSNIGLQRERSRGHVGDADIKSFALVAPHIRRAMQLAHSLGSIRAGWQSSLAVLHTVPQGLIIVNRSGRASFVNAAAEEILRTGDALHLKDGYLTAKRQSDAHRLGRALQDALSLATGETTAPGKWVGINRPTTSLPYSIYIAPLHSETPLIEDEGAGAMIVIHDLTRKAKVDDQILTNLFGLTSKEARVASEIGSGTDLKSAAEGLQITPATARVHLGSIYRKLSIGRQQDLVGIVHSLTPLRS
jgi:DNA-binding CsgD family transcriptional regulator